MVCNDLPEVSEGKNAMTDIRLLDHTELSLVSGGNLRIPFQILSEVVRKSTKSTTSEPVPSKDDTQSPVPKSASFDPVTIRF